MQCKTENKKEAANNTGLMEFVAQFGIIAWLWV
jgi:hypothetical protein